MKRLDQAALKNRRVASKARVLPSGHYAQAPDWVGQAAAGSQPAFDSANREKPDQGSGAGRGPPHLQTNAYTSFACIQKKRPAEKDRRAAPDDAGNSPPSDQTLLVSTHFT